MNLYKAANRVFRPQLMLNKYGPDSPFKKELQGHWGASGG